MEVDSKSNKRNYPQWDIKLTGELVTAAFGASQWKNKAHPSVRSMTDRPEFCHYHYHEAFNLMNEYIESKLDEVGLFGIWNDYDGFSYVMLKIRANIVAFVQSLHSIADNCSHMIYYSLAMDGLPEPLEDRDICANSVLKILRKQRRADRHEYGKLYELFNSLTAGADYKYLCALNNTLKHRSVVCPELNEDATGKREEKWILFIDQFSYSGKIFEKTNARTFMQKEHDRIQHLTVNIGIELNEVLKKLQPSTATDLFPST